MGIFDRVFGIDKLVEAQIKAQMPEFTKEIGSHIDAAFVKAVSPPANPTGKTGMMRYQMSPTLQQNTTYSRQKPDSNVPFDVLRRFSVAHEVSRAAINYRKRQLAGLEWDIVAEEHEDTNDYTAEAKEIKKFFKTIGGPSNKYRKFIARETEDILVLDAVSLYKQRTNGGKLYTLIPIDPTTIRLRVGQAGETPIPPEIAYRQVIRGAVVAELTTDEMVYDMMNPRTNSPYGLAAIESLMIVVQSSLKAGLANMAFLTEGNIPEGFFGVPDSWTPQMINDFQENWDAVMAGDETATAKLRFTPEGSYTATKKPSDMAWQEFNEWLMKVTCAMFDVPPSEIGFTHSKGGLGDKGSNQIQQQAADSRGLVPLAQFFEEIFTDIIQNELGYENLKFSYVGLKQDEDALVKAQVAEVQIRSGQRTINEIRTDEGLDTDESPLADKLMITTGTPTFLYTQEELDAKAEIAATIASGAAANNAEETPPTEDKKTDEEAPADSTQKMVALVTEFRKFRKMALTRKKAGKTFRPFTSDLLPAETVNEMNDRIAKAETADDIKKTFSEYMQDYQINFIADVVELQGNLQKILG